MIARRLILASLAALCALACGLVVASAPAWAAPPTIEAESSREVGSSSVRLRAIVNPNSDPSSYFFEYGTTAGYGTKTTAESVGAGTEGVAVFVTLSELQPETEYHFRVVAVNASEETALGGDETFRTEAAPPPAQVGLPDDRGYELVSPYMENANVFTQEISEESLLFQVAPDGSAVSFVGEPPPAGGNGSTLGRTAGGNQYLARRAAGGGWTTGVIEPEGGTHGGGSYVGFSGDMSVGFLSGAGLVEGDGGGLYSREESGGGYSFLAPNATYVDSTADGSHVLIESGGGLLDSVGGRLVPVSVLPDGEAASEATFGSPPGPDFVEASGRRFDLDGVVSEDGSRVFWSTMEEVGQSRYRPVYRPTGIYVREDDASADAKTVQVDASQGGPGSSGGGRFWAASSDGSRVYFTDESRLTADSTAAPGEPDLYVFDVETEKLTDLTVDANPGEHANVQGLVGAGESAEGGAYVYFVADGALASGAEPERCTGRYKLPGELCNLYVLHEGEPPKFIAVLSPHDDEPEEAGSYRGDWQSDLGERESEVTPDGRHLAFMRQEQLEGRHYTKLFVYEAGVGSLSCVSCSVSTGEYVTVPVSWHEQYQPRFISDDGSRVFFEERTGREGSLQSWVYEWERDGSGSCGLGGGCVYLLARGESHAQYDSGDYQSLLGASASGDDVFFLSREQLVPQDGDEDVHVYDARVGARQPLAALACTSSGCQGAPAPAPVFATPASVTFAGVGDFPAASRPVGKASVKPKKHKGKRKRRRKGARSRGARGSGGLVVRRARGAVARGGRGRGGRS
jgi:hypothetical protein